ncbi:MAG TPA: glutathione S-transferase N-terminal domain-containing protein [Burkholderiales bacterium]
MKLIIARPSPFARKVRIALLEKQIPHDLEVDNPWIEAAVGAVNPLGKVPALVLDDGQVLFDSRVIVGYLEALGAPPAVLPASSMARVAHRQIEALADGICDAVVLITLERARPPERRSADWIARQSAKISPALAELERRLGAGPWFTQHGYGLAEIAAGCALGYLDLRDPQRDWRAAAPGLAALKARLDARPAFAATRPQAQAIPPT